MENVTCKYAKTWNKVMEMRVYGTLRDRWLFLVWFGFYQKN